MAKLYLILPLLTLWSISHSWCQDVPSAHREMVIKNVNVITMINKGILYDQDVWISNGVIKSISNAKKKHKPGTVAIEGKGKFLIPGLSEMHAHVPPGISGMEKVEETMLLYLANGITTIRGMLGHENHLKIKKLITADSILAPRFFTSGPSINGMSVTSPEKGAEMVRRQKQMGFDFLKMHPGLSNEKYDAISKTAQEEGMAMCGHISFGVGIWKSIETGYSTIDHLDGFIEGLVPDIKDFAEQQAGPFGANVANRADLSKIPTLIDALKKHNVWVVPTQSLVERIFSPQEIPERMAEEPAMKYVPEKTVQTWVTQKRQMLEDTAHFNAKEVENFISLRRQLIKACYHSGVGMLLGSDAPQTFNVTGFAIHNELKSMVDAGLTPYEALRMGTVNPAQYFNSSQEFGTLQKGLIADMVLLDKNPLEDITRTSSIAGVMVRGKWLSRQFIDSRLEAISKQYHSAAYDK